MRLPGPLTPIFPNETRKGSVATGNTPWACSAPAASFDSPFSDPGLFMYFPQVCSPALVLEVETGAPATFGSAYSTATILGGRHLVYSNVVGGQVASGVQSVPGAPDSASASISVMPGVIGDGYIVAGAIEVGVKNIGGTLRAQATVVTTTPQTLIATGATALSTGVEVFVQVYYDAVTGAVRLFVNGVIDGSADGTPAPIDTITSSWQVFLPPSSYMTNAAVWGSLVIPEPPQPTTLNLIATISGNWSGATSPDGYGNRAENIMTRSDSTFVVVDGLSDSVSRFTPSMLGLTRIATTGYQPPLHGAYASNLLPGDRLFFASWDAQTHGTVNAATTLAGSAAVGVRPAIAGAHFYAGFVYYRITGGFIRKVDASSAIPSVVSDTSDSGADTLLAGMSNLLVSANNSQCRIYNLSSGTPTVVSTPAVTTNVPGSVCFLTTSLLLVGTNVLDISNPASPVVVSTLPLSGANIRLSGTRVAVISNGTQRIYDLTNPAAPTLVASSAYPINTNSGARSGRYLLTGGGTGNIFVPGTLYLFDLLNI